MIDIRKLKVILHTSRMSELSFNQGDPTIGRNIHVIDVIYTNHLSYFFMTFTKFMKKKTTKTDKGLI